ncbi:DUF6415 family natural product biosynthesis protein [Streptomyces sp. NPDC098789]|uniref:DUF6415 family natural product biosynthesis protein n=1 Tax=Streptomyces sp. NPDC098789 TaxID=3366098 RepID=UPI00382882BF
MAPTAKRAAEDVSTDPRWQAQLLPRRSDAMAVSFSTDPDIAAAGAPSSSLRQVPRIRSLAKAHMEYCGLPELADDVALIVSELVTNAIQHGRGPDGELCLVLQDDSLLVSVTDGVSSSREARTATEDEEHGRGLTIVNAIAEEHRGRWGVTPNQTGTWCELPVHDPGCNMKPLDIRTPEDVPAEGWRPPLPASELWRLARQHRTGVAVDDLLDLIGEVQMRGPELEEEAVLEGAERFRGALMQLVGAVLELEGGGQSGESVNALVEQARTLRKEEPAGRGDSLAHLRRLAIVTEAVLDVLLDGAPEMPA